MTDLKPFADRVILRKLQAEQSAGGVVLPQHRDAVEKARRGEVVSAGAKVADELGHDLAEGDVVYYAHYGGVEFEESDAKDLIALRAVDLLAYEAT